MNETEKAYINLISAFIRKKTISIDFSKVDLDYLVHLCKIHDNVGVVYVGLKNVPNVPPDITALYEQGFYTELMVYSKRMTVYYQLLEELQKNRIRHLIMKGMSIASLYPQEEVRTMNDIDLLVDEENISKITELLEQMGAMYEVEVSNEHVRVFRWKRICIEIHTGLACDEDFAGKYNYQQYFAPVFSRACQIQPFTYQMCPMDNMIYALYHLAKHFYNGGCGVRMITDIAVMFQYYKETLDWQTFWKQLEKMGLKPFAENILYLCEQWFGIQMLEKHKEKPDISIAEKYILSGGVFGYRNMSADAMEIKNQKSGCYIVSVLRWAFPSYKKMRQHSLWFAEKPAILLPVAYIERFLRNARERDGILQWFRLLKKGRQQTSEHDKILEIMELK